MKVEQQLFDPSLRSLHRSGDLHGLHPQLALVFGGRPVLEQPATLATLHRAYPGTQVVLVSTSGEFLDTSITDNHLAVTALAFEHSRLTCAAITVRNQFESREAGRTLAARLRAYGLRHVLAFSDGQLVNGTALVDGFNDILPAGVTLSGGLAGDSTEFVRTVAGLDETPIAGRIVAVGLYGQRLQIGCGSSGGWSPTGDEHTITSASGNIVFQLDGRPALDVYRALLSPADAAALPASGLRFPICITTAADAPTLVRSVLGIDENFRSLWFGGDTPTGGRLRFMQASHDDLIGGAALAAEQARLGSPAEFALCVSCAGRRALLGSRTGEELAAVGRVLGAGVPFAGFYSYGELGPAGPAQRGQLHNQTMTLATLREA